MHMKVGYARTSTSDQKAGFEAQLAELEQAGCEKVFKEQVSSVAHRAQLDAALDFIREGDTLVVSKLDRLARSTQHLLEIADRVKRGCPPACLEPRHGHGHRHRQAAADRDRGHRTV
jgi:DNA invertase Pin-like site-specific DNA recombinase